MAYQYQNRSDEFLQKLKGKTGKISDQTHEEHMKLYTGYVNKSNAILAELEKLGTPDPGEANQTYSAIRSLKVDLTFALGGVKNHEIYFESLGGDGKADGKIAELINRDFGSMENFQKDLKATGIAGRGWAWTGLDHHTGKLFNYIGDAQNTFPVWGVTPVLALDVYEHAYYLDFATGRAGYIDEYFKYIDWSAVNARLPQL